MREQGQLNAVRESVHGHTSYEKLPTKRRLRQFSRGTPLNTFVLVGLPPDVVHAERPFQRGEFKRAQVFFGEIAESPDRLLFHMTLFNGARAAPA